MRRKTVDVLKYTSTQVCATCDVNEVLCFIYILCTNKIFGSDQPEQVRSPNRTDDLIVRPNILCINNIEHAYFCQNYLLSTYAPY